MPAKGYQRQTPGQGPAADNNTGCFGSTEAGVGGIVSLDRLISMGQRAGKIVSGAFAVKSNINRGRVKLLLIAADAAAQSVQELNGLATARGVPVLSYGSKDDLGRLIGKSARAALAITDQHMARGILEAFERGEVNRTEPKTWR
jgi:ribosomal protein L7Ae-like RNA K-turn-binding protein